MQLQYLFGTEIIRWFSQIVRLDIYNNTIPFTNMIILSRKVKYKLLWYSINVGWFLVNFEFSVCEAKIAFRWRQSSRLVVIGPPIKLTIIIPKVIEVVISILLSSAIWCAVSCLSLCSRCWLRLLSIAGSRIAAWRALRIGRRLSSSRSRAALLSSSWPRVTLLSSLNPGVTLLSSLRPRVALLSFLGHSVTLLSTSCSSSRLYTQQNL